MEKWSTQDFKEYVKQCIDSYYWDTASAIALKSFYIAEVEKEPGVTIRMFDYLYSIAKKEIQVYKITKEGLNEHRG